MTIVITTRNRAHYLPDSIRSVLAQSHASLDVIVMDSGTDERARAAVAQFHDPRLRYMVNSNDQGVMQNINKALHLGSSPYLLVFHDDDAMHPLLIGAQVAAMEANPEIIFVGAGYREKADAEIQRYEPVDASAIVMFRRRREFVERLMTRGDLAFPSVMYRAEVLGTAQMDSERFATSADRPFLVELMRRGPAALLVGPWINYRIHPDQATQVRAVPVHQVEALSAYYRSVLVDDSASASTLSRHLIWSTNALLDAYQIHPRNSRPSFAAFWRRNVRGSLVATSALRRAGLVALKRIFLR